MAVAVKGVDSVIALAALVGDAACDLDPEETISINVEATQLLADVCERARVPRLVFASSCSVYGANSELILNEGSWLNPISLYAQSRIKSEDILLRHTERVGVTILRLATVFGLSPRMRLDLLVNTFTAHAFFNRKIRIFGGQQWRPHLHVQDAADAFIRASTAPDERVHGEVFNVGHSVLNSTVLEVAELVKGMLPSHADRGHGHDPGPPGLPSRLRQDPPRPRLSDAIPGRGRDPGDRHRVPEGPDHDPRGRAPSQLPLSQDPRASRGGGGGALAPSRRDGVPPESESCPLAFIQHSGGTHVDHAIPDRSDRTQRRGQPRVRRGRPHAARHRTGDSLLPDLREHPASQLPDSSRRPSPACRGSGSSSP